MAKKHNNSTSNVSTASSVEATSPNDSFATYNQDDGFWKQNWWMVLLIFATSIGIYYQCTNFGYVLDDQIVITDNDFTKKGLAGVKDLLTTESMTGYFKEQKNLVQGNRYRPLSLITFAVEYEMFDRLNPRFSHWVNILLYALTIVIMLRLLSLLFTNNRATYTYKKWLAIAVAMLYLVHPLHVEAVANIKGRDEVMAMLFSLATLYYAYRAVMEGKRWMFMFSGMLFFLGLLSKENTITFLAVIPLTIYIFSNRTIWHSIKPIFPYLLVTTGYMILRFAVSGVPQLGAESNDLMNNPFLGMSGMERFSTIMYTLLLYVKLLFIPWPLTHDYYPYAIPIMKLTDWQVILAVVFYGGCTFAFIKGLKNRNPRSFALGFYLITLSIVSNFVINLGTFMNDRFIFMPSLGFCIALVLGLTLLSQKFMKNNSIAYLMIGLVVAGFGTLSTLRVPDWKDAMSLNTSALKVSKNSARANTFMSTALFEKARATEDTNEKLKLFREALPYAEKSAQIHPNYYNAHLMVSGIVAEIHKVDGDIGKFVDGIEAPMLARPDIPFITDYLNYLNNRNTNEDQLFALYIKVAQQLIQRNKGEDAKWAIHYLNMIYKKKTSYPQVNRLIGEAYMLVGETVKGQSFIKAEGI